MTYSIKLNPRYEAAPFERGYIMNQQVMEQMKKDGKVSRTIDDAGNIKVPYPNRYSSVEDGMANINRIPPFLKVYEDGTTEESW